MIFKYNYINNEAEQLQELVKHIVCDVWCNAQGKRFNLNKITEENGFREKVNRTTIYLKKPIHKIFKICSRFDNTKLEYIKQAFIKNNNIKDLCNNTITPVFYKDLANNTTQEFANEIKSFFNNLYEKVFNQQPFNLNNHYDSFFQHNKRLCPFCGIEPLAKNSSNRRADYDHYLPKDIYPFNAVNLKNLVPMCRECNQSWKKIKNPINDGTNVKKAFYYYGDTEPDYAIEIEILNIDLQNFDVNVILYSETMQEEVESWNRVFSLSQRYKDDVICHENIGISWIRHIYSNKQRSPNYNVQNDLNYYKENLIDDKNFLKVPLIEACIDKNII